MSTSHQHPAGSIAKPAGEHQPRVLILPPSYFAHDRTVGGGERYALEYARALAELTPTTLALFGSEASTQCDGTLDIRTYRLRRFDQRLSLPITWPIWRDLERFDVLHAMVFPTPITDALLLSARWRHQTLVLTDVGGGGPCWSIYLQRLHPRLNLNRLAHGLALLSRHAAQLFADWAQPKEILYGGADLNRFAAADHPLEGYALFVGRLLLHKGALQLVQAVSPNTPLRMIGRPYDAAYFAQLQAAAQGKKVTFILEADDAELQRQYAGASVVLQPSLPLDTPGVDTSELLGLVTLEAMASGKPVIVTRTASLPELVREGETGFIVPPNDPAALRSALEKLVAQPQLSLQMGAAARRHVEGNFTWSQVAQRGLSFYRRLSQAHSGVTP